MSTTRKFRLNVRRFGLILIFSVAILVTMKLTLTLGPVANASTAAFIFFILVLLSAFFGDLLVGIATSVIATLCFDYSFLQPVGTFYITDFADWISLAAFLLTATIISRLTASAARNKTAAEVSNRTLIQLKELGARLLALSNERITLSGIAEETAQRLSLDYCAIHVHGDGKWSHYTGGAGSVNSPEIQNKLKLLEDRPTDLMGLVDEYFLDVMYMPICQGSKTHAFLVVKSKTLPPAAMGALAYLIGIRLTNILDTVPSVRNSLPPQ